MWLLHIVLALFLLYSGYHAVSASLKYAGSSELAKFAQIVGICATELVMFGIYLAWHNHRITGPGQSIVAGLVYSLGFIISGLGIIADSQVTANLDVSTWLVWYLAWGLPIAPAFMGLGAILIHELGPEQLQSRRRKTKLLAHQELEFDAALLQSQAELKNKQIVLNARQKVQRTVAEQVRTYMDSEKVQELIKREAESIAPAILSFMGFDIKNLSGGELPTGNVNQQTPPPQPQSKPKSPPAMPNAVTDEKGNGRPSNNRPT
jgi:hypothetical protein